MSNTADILNVLKGMHKALQNIEKNGGATFSQGFSDINIQALTSLAKSTKEVKENLKTSDEYMKDFADSAETAANNFEKSSKKVDQVLKGTVKFVDKAFGTKLMKRAEKLHKSALNTGNAIKGWFGALRKADSGFKKIQIAANGLALAINKTLGGLLEIIPVFGKVLSGIFSIGAAITKTIIGALTSALSAAGQFAKFLVTLPASIANRAAEIGNKLRQELVEVIGQAVENTKELFDMASNGGSAFARLGNIAKGSLLSFQSVNSTMTKLFGFGAQGAANMVSSVTKNIADMGLFADVFAKSTTRTGESIEFITRMTKGMGMQGDDLNYVVREAMKNGEHYFETMTRMKESSDSVSAEFGLNRKLLSKNFFQLRKDITNFGHLSDIELQKVAARATQLGVEMKDLAGVFNKFGTFEDAANSAALLSQTFGMNVDALQLIRAEDPMEIVRMFRDSMMATGRSFDDLNRHEKALMATHTGMSVETLKTAMNYRNVGKSYEEIKKIMNDQKPEERQIRAMKDMRSSMSEIQKIMDKKDFLTSFTDGLSKTILYSTKFKSELIGMSKNMQNFYENGLRVDSKDVDRILAPFSDIMKSIRKLFSPREFKKVTKQFLKSLGDFVTQIKPSSIPNWKGISNKWHREIYGLFDLKRLVNNKGFIGKLTREVGKIIGFVLKAITIAAPAIIQGVGDMFLQIFRALKGESVKNGLKPETIAKFLGMDVDTWNQISKNIIESLRSLKAYLFGDIIEIEVNKNKYQKKVDSIFTRLSRDFRDFMADSGIFKMIGKGLIEGMALAVDGLKVIGSVIANTFVGAITGMTDTGYNKKKHRKSFDEAFQAAKERLEKAIDDNLYESAPGSPGGFKMLPHDVKKDKMLRRQLEDLVKNKESTFDRLSNQEAIKALKMYLNPASTKYGSEPVRLGFNVAGMPLHYDIGGGDAAARNKNLASALDPDKRHKKIFEIKDTSYFGDDRKENLNAVVKNRYVKEAMAFHEKPYETTLNELTSYLEAKKADKRVSPEEFNKIARAIQDFVNLQSSNSQMEVTVELGGEQVGQIVMKEIARLQTDSSRNATGVKPDGGFKSRTSFDSL